MMSVKHDLKLACMFTVGLTLAVAPASAQWSAGVAAIGSATPYEGLSTESIVIPIVAYEGERLIWRGPSLRYKLTGVKRGEPSLQISVELAPNELEADQSAELVGIEERDISFLAGLRYVHPSKIGEFSAVFQTDITGKHNGQRGALNFQRPLLRDKQGAWVLTGGIQVEYLSDNYADYYFGVSAVEEAASSFSQYRVDDVWQGGITLGGFYRFNDKWQLTAQTRLISLANEVKDSPIVADSATFDGFIGVTYQF
ncbi:MipA/OmpV family protein [Ningiella sp. W23]|uniref:MipA/OmpV family protein n=1 Tax=Ningiella sp. W23 TaxID=3023715 RepID=UPI0037582849